MKKIQMFVGKVVRKADVKFLSNGSQLQVVTVVFDGDKKDDPARFFDIPFFSDKATGQLPNVLQYINKGSVIGIEGSDVAPRAYVTGDGQPRVSESFSPYVRIHLIPRDTSVHEDEGTVPDSPAVGTDEEDESDPFAE